MEFVFEGDVSYSGYVLFYDYDVDSTKAPKLHIEYTEAAAGGSWAGTWGG
jgi:hypothetical protein